MEKRRLGRTGLSVPVVGLGTYRVFNVHDDVGRARCEAVVDAALDEGASLFDSSPMYGEAESVLADAIADRRDECIVATKVWARDRALGEQQIEAALSRYQTVELYQIHNMLAVDDHLPVLHRLKRSGSVAAVGLTHYLPSAIPRMIELMHTGMIDCVQVPYHPNERSIEAELLPAAERLGVGVIVMSPLGTGRLLGGRLDPATMAPLADWGVFTWAQALLKWILSDPRITAVIPATSSVDHMRENAAAGHPPWFDSTRRQVVRPQPRASY